MTRVTVRSKLGPMVKRVTRASRAWGAPPPLATPPMRASRASGGPLPLQQTVANLADQLAARIAPVGGGGGGGGARVRAERSVRRAYPEAHKDTSMLLDRCARALRAHGGLRPP